MINIKYWVKSKYEEVAYVSHTDFKLNRFTLEVKSDKLNKALGVIRQQEFQSLFWPMLVIETGFALTRLVCFVSSENQS